MTSDSKQTIRESKTEVKKKFLHLLRIRLHTVPHNMMRLVATVHSSTKRFFVVDISIIRYWEFSSAAPITINPYNCCNFWVWCKNVTIFSLNLFRVNFQVAVNLKVFHPHRHSLLPLQSPVKKHSQSPPPLHISRVSDGTLPSNCMSD